jgi:hypothetical protein
LWQLVGLSNKVNVKRDIYACCFEMSPCCFVLSGEHSALLAAVAILLTALSLWLIAYVTILCQSFMHDARYCVNQGISSIKIFYLHIFLCLNFKIKKSPCCNSDGID